jgi:hypothetical protein
MGSALVFAAGFPNIDFFSLVMPWLAIGPGVLVVARLIICGFDGEGRGR